MTEQQDFKTIASLLKKEALALADGADLDADPNKLLSSIKTHVTLGKWESSVQHPNRVVTVAIDGRADLFEHYVLHKSFFRDKPGFVYGFCENDSRKVDALIRRMKSELAVAVMAYNDQAEKLSRSHHDVLASRLIERKRKQTPPETMEEVLARHGVVNKDES